MLDLDYGQRRPTTKHAAQLARLVAAARDEHGLSESEIRQHCRATLQAAKTSPVPYLLGGLAPDRLPMPRPRSVAKPSTATRPTSTEYAPPLDRQRASGNQLE
ncbi:hypothetical protein, partial [Nonomuraea sp. NPDC059022]|uniref:hypothetical protein n=1 Tax=Nonomuraea sp. NPDC059022 TaxID=3346705 RepID=UPI00368B497C